MRLSEMSGEMLAQMVDETSGGKMVGNMPNVNFRHFSPIYYRTVLIATPPP